MKKKKIGKCRKEKPDFCRDRLVVYGGGMNNLDKNRKGGKGQNNGIEESDFFFYLSDSGSLRS